MDGKVVYYHGCYVNYFDVETGLAVVRVLEKNHLKVEVPKLECCSFPLVNSGDLVNARKRAMKLIDTLGVFALRGYDIVYSCPTCGYALKEVYPVLSESESASLVAERTSFISTYFLELRRTGELNVDFKKTALQVVYHTPCHLRSQDLSTVSAELLALIPGINVRYLDRGCCGMGGMWGLRSKQQGELSERIGAHLFEEIKETDPQLVATDCAGCQIQIARQTGRTGNEVVHPVRILSEAYP